MNTVLYVGGPFDGQTRTVRDLRYQSVVEGPGVWLEGEVDPNAPVEVRTAGWYYHGTAGNRGRMLWLENNLPETWVEDMEALGVGGLLEARAHFWRARELRKVYWIDDRLTELGRGDLTPH